MTEPRGFPVATNADLAAVAAALVLFDAVALMPTVVPGTIRAAIVVWFVLVTPGYVVVAALFPGCESGAERLSVLGRLVLGVGASVGCVVVVGLIADASGVGVQFRLLFVGLNAVTIAGLVAAVVRRRGHRGGAAFGVDTEAVAGRSRRFLVGDGRVDLALSVVLVVCLGSLVGAVYLVPADDGGATPEASLLTERGDGLVASGYPTDLSIGEATTLHLSVGDGREKSGEATVVVTLDELDDGTVSASTEVDRFVIDLPDEEPVVSEHEVVPSVAGEDLRLTYLVYFGTVPDDPAPATADRQVHLRVTVAE